MTSEQRTDFTAKCIRLYVEQGLSLRGIVQNTGRSYGTVHAALVSAQIPMRPRGKPQGRERAR